MSSHVRKSKVLIYNFRNPLKGVPKETKPVAVSHGGERRHESLQWCASIILCDFVAEAIKKKKEKGEWWMPRLKEAKKDVVSCEKLRGGANDL